MASEPHGTAAACRRRGSGEGRSRASSPSSSRRPRASPAPATCRSSRPRSPKGAPPAPPPIPEIPEEKLPDVEPGGPRTLLVLGSDRRAKNSTDAKLYGQAEQPHSDTIVLVRLDPKRNRIAVMSLPRDLAVTIPGYADNTKINQAYDEGGAGLTLDTVKLLFSNAIGREMTINSVIDVNFNGFQRAVNYIGGVYVDVDRRLQQPRGHRVRGDRHQARLPAARRLGRARLRPLPPHGLRHLPQRAPAGVPAPGGQPAGGRQAQELRRGQGLPRHDAQLLPLRQEVPLAAATSRA